MKTETGVKCMVQGILKSKGSAHYKTVLSWFYIAPQYRRQKESCEWGWRKKGQKKLSRGKKIGAGENLSLLFLALFFSHSNLNDTDVVFFQRFLSPGFLSHVCRPWKVKFGLECSEKQLHTDICTVKMPNLKFCSLASQQLLPPVAAQMNAKGCGIPLFNRFFLFSTPQVNAAILKTECSFYLS